MDLFPHDYEVNAFTWVCLSLVLMCAVFFRFGRVWSLRNLDLTLLLSVSPPLLLVEHESTAQIGFIWLFAVTGLILLRLLADPLLRRRPHLVPNLNAQGSAFLCLAAFLLLTLQAFQAPPPTSTVETLQAADRMMAGQEASGPESSAGPAAALIAAPFNALFGVELFAARAAAVLSHLIVILGLVFVGRNLFGDAQLGIGMATLYMLLPCTAFDVAEVNHVLPAALTVWALVAYRRPMVSGALLGLACGVMFFPVFLIPIWAAFYGRRGIIRFSAALLLIGSAVCSVVALTSIDPDSFFRQTIGTIHPEILFFETPEAVSGFWTASIVAYRIPVIVSFFLLLIALTAWPRNKSVEHLVSASAAVLVATQFWYPQQGGVYVLWYLPLLLVAMFRPRLLHLQTTGLRGERRARRPADVSGAHAPNASKSAERPHLFR